MSIYTTPISTLMQLDKNALAYALRTFDKELAGILDLLQQNPEARKDEELLNDLNQALTLRKAVLGRLEELTEEAGQAPADGSTPLALAA